MRERLAVIGRVNRDDRHGADLEVELDVVAVGSAGTNAGARDRLDGVVFEIERR
jgi:hypothetical protein